MINGTKHVEGMMQKKKRDKNVQTRSYHYRLLPDEAQAAELHRQLTAHRMLYNAALEQRSRYVKPTCYEKQQQEDGMWVLRTVHYKPHKEDYRVQRRYDVMQQGAEKKGLAAFWPEVFSGVSSHSLGQTLMRLDSNFTAFFKGIRGYPKFKSARTFNTISWYMQGGGGSFEKINSVDHLYLFGVGVIAVNWHRPLPRDVVVKQATVTHDNGKWYVCFQMNFPAESYDSLKPVVVDASGKLTRSPYVDSMSNGLGDAGVKLTCREVVMSTGESYELSSALNDNLKRLAFWQQRVDRRKPAPFQQGSKRYQIAKQHVNRIHQKIRNIRKDHNHKLSRKLAQSYGTLVIEDLNIHDMVKDSPKSKDVARKVLDASWGNLRNNLKYKCAEEGCELIIVESKNTTRECSNLECGHVSEKPLTGKKFKCPVCGHTEQKQLNAARNIGTRGIREKICAEIERLQRPTEKEVCLV